MKDGFPCLLFFVALLLAAGCSHSFSLDYHRYHLRDGTYMDLEKEYQDRSYIYGYEREEHTPVRIVRTEVLRSEKFTVDFGPCPDCVAEEMADNLATELTLSMLEDMEGEVEDPGLLAAIVLPLAIFQGISRVEHIDRQREHALRRHLPPKGFDWTKVQQIPSDEEIEEWEAWIESGNTGMIPTREEAPSPENQPE